MVLTYQAYNPRIVSDNFYGSTQSRLRKYNADRRLEERNGEVQQSKVYQKLAEDIGDLETADRLAKLATMVINKFGQSVQEHKVQDTIPINQQQFDIRNYLKQAIQSGTLSQLWDRMKKVPDSQLSKKAQIVKSDIKHNTLMRDILNEKLAPVFEKKVNESKIPSIVTDIIQTLSGGDESIITEIVQKASEANANVAKTVGRTGKTTKSTTSSNAATEQQSDMGNPNEKQYTEEQRIIFMKNAIDNVVKGYDKSNGVKSLVTWVDKDPTNAKRLIKEHKQALLDAYPKSKKLKDLIAGI